MVFDLPVMKCMTLTQLSERHEELEQVDQLLQQEEYKWVALCKLVMLCRKLNERIHRISDRNLHDLVDECRRFREQKKRVVMLED